MMARIPNPLLKGGPHSNPLGVDIMSEAMANTTQQVVIHKDDDALSRQRLWEHLGCPVAPKHMDEERYKREYRGRHWFCSREVFVQAQSALKIIFCPECRTETDFGALTASRFFIRVENDVMTVFKAMAQCSCHGCGFQEYYPLTHDPRLRQQADAEEVNKYSREFIRDQMMSQARSAAGNAMGSGIYGGALNVGAALGGTGGAGSMGRSLTHEMTATEAEALQRLYGRAMQSAINPPVQAIPPPEKQRYEDLINSAPAGMRKLLVDAMRKRGII